MFWGTQTYSEESVALPTVLLLVPSGVQPGFEAFVDVQAVPTFARQLQHCDDVHVARGTVLHIVYIVTYPHQS